MKKKRMLPLFLTLSMAATLMPVSVWAENDVASDVTNPIELKTVSGPFGGGEGTAEDPYQIGSVEDLKELRDAVNGGESYAGCYFVLTADIDLSQEEWVPIGQNLGAGSISYFAGSFDGDGNTISNLTITQTYTDDAFSDPYQYGAYGLFGAAGSGASFSDLILENPVITLDQARNAAALLGGVAYCATKEAVEISDVTVIGADLTANGRVGGLVGWVIDSTKGVVITDCSVTGDLSALYNTEVSDDGDKAGGIIGLASSECVLEGCAYSDGTVSAYREAAGLIGTATDATFTLQQCTVEQATIEQDKTSGTYGTPNCGQLIGRTGSNSFVVAGNSFTEVDVIADNTPVNGFGSGSADVTAYVAKAGETYFETLEKAISESAEGAEIELLAPVSISSTIELDKELTIQGSEAAYITFTGSASANLFEVTTDAQITLNDLYGDVGRVMSLNTSSPHVTLNDCEFYAEQRGISFIQDGVATDASLILDGTIIRCTNNVDKDGDFGTEASYDGQHRGISVYDVQNSEIVLKNNSELSGFCYSINVTGVGGGSQIVDNSGLVITVEDSLIRGWTSFNVWGSFATYRVIDSVIVGINNNQYNSFSAITFNGDIYEQFGGSHAYANELYIEDSTITNYQNGDIYTPSGKVVLEELLRIDNGITKLTFAGTVKFIDSTNKLTTALDISSMDVEDRVGFLRECIFTEEGANVVLQPEGLDLHDAYVFPADPGNVIYLVSDFVIDYEEIIPEGVTVDAGEYKFILQTGGSLTAYEDLSNIIEVPSGYRLLTKGDAENGYTYTIQRKSSGSSSSGSSSSTDTDKETTENEDGSITTTETKPDGTKVETTEKTDGSVVVVETAENGTVTTTVETADGSTSKTTVTEDEDVTIEVVISEEAASKQETIILPVSSVSAQKDANQATAISIKVENNSTAVVEVPVEDMTAGTVAVLVQEDGTEEVVKTSAIGENGVIFALEGEATVKIVDNSTEFTDVADTHWGADAVQFATSRALFSGTAENIFSPESPMTRAMTVTVLANLDGQDISGGTLWYEKARDWAVKEGISDGSEMTKTITREQLAVMLYQYMGCPDCSASLPEFTDKHEISSWALDAMTWAVNEGLLSGMGDGSLQPGGIATRVQVASIFTQLIQNQHVLNN